MIEAKDACCSLHAQHWNKWKGWLKRNELYWEVFWPGTMTAGSWKTWKCMICIFLFPFKCHLIFVVKSKVEVCFVNWSLQLFGCSWGLCAIFLEMILRCCQMRHDFYKAFFFGLLMILNQCCAKQNHQGGGYTYCILDSSGLKAGFWLKQNTSVIEWLSFQIFLCVKVSAG